MLALLLLPLALAADPVLLDVGIPLSLGADGQYYQEDLPVWRTGSLIVSLKTEDADWVRDLDGVDQIRRLNGGPATFRVQMRPGHDELALSAFLQGDPRLRYAHPNMAVELHPHALPNDPFFEDQWHLRNVGQASDSSLPGSDINVLPAWEITQGEGLIIAILDSGVDTSHPDLDIVPGFTSDSVGDENPDLSYSGHGHGTACAGLAAGKGDNGLGVAGVAPQAQIMGVRILGAINEWSDIHDAIVYAVDNGAGVLSNSWGNSETCASFTLPEVVFDGLYHAEEVGRNGYGSAWVMSMGNDDCDNSNDGYMRVSSTIGVGSLNDQDRLAAYSNYGKNMDIVASSGDWGRPMMVTTDITGEEGYGAHKGDDNYTGGFSGTSAAAPVVSGVVALMFASNPRLDIWTAVDVICQTAVRVNPEEAEYDEDGESVLYGCGRIDAGAAVQAIANQPPGVPQDLSPGEDVYLDQATLRWSPAVDADGEPLLYEVRMWLAEDPDAAWDITDLDQPQLDMRPDVDYGNYYGAKVRAVDAWGPGEWSEAVEFKVKRTPGPPEPEGCSTGGRSSSAAWLFAMGGLLLMRRRR
jgi:subtilisin family serine protease